MIGLSMRIVLDLQACQSSSRFRGIGRYSMSLALVMVKKLLADEHEIIILLNSAFSEEVRQVRELFENVSPQIRFSVFSIPENCAAEKPDNQWRQMAARILREHAIAALEPDVVHVATLLADGWVDDLVASVDMLGLHIPTVLTHYDLIPLIMSDMYLSDSRFRDYYLRKLADVSKADLLLAISDYSRKEALSHFDLPEMSIVNISSAINDDFFEQSLKSSGVDVVLNKYGIESGFILYAPGGFDPRKNVDRLLEAYSLLPDSVRKEHKLVIASKLPSGFREGLIWKAGTFGVDSSDVILTDYVPDSELVDLYRGCCAYIFPSLHEGFGLPVLEAMLCGAVVIASNCTSIPEAHGLTAALFDPYQPVDMADKMLLALTSDDFRIRLKNHAIKHVVQFSWERSAQTAVSAIEDLFIKNQQMGVTKTLKMDLPSCDDLLAKVEQLGLDIKPDSSDLECFRTCYNQNLEGNQ
jgi:glycosyltransferase involved in cell wall biosynthesis